MFIEEILEKIFIPPFEFDGIYIWDSNNRMVADIDEEQWHDEDTINHIVDRMNNNSSIEPIKGLSVHSDNYDCNILINNKQVVLRMRGWGYLTSSYHCNFSNTSAAKIQEEFAKWIVKQCEK